MLNSDGNKKKSKVKKKEQKSYRVTKLINGFSWKGCLVITGEWWFVLPSPLRHDHQVNFLAVGVQATCWLHHFMSNWLASCGWPDWLCAYDMPSSCITIAILQYALWSDTECCANDHFYTLNRNGYPRSCRGSPRSRLLSNRVGSLEQSKWKVGSIHVTSKKQRFLHIFLENLQYWWSLLPKLAGWVLLAMLRL